MLIIQEPTNNGLYFHSAIPDVIVEKNNASTGITFELKYSGATVLKENYSYDSESRIRVRNIGDVVANYFAADSVVFPSTHIIQNTGIILPFTIKITEGSTIVEHSFNAIRCDAHIGVDPSTWLAENFLTRSYRGKRTAKDWNEYLSFLVQPSQGQVVFNYKIVYLENGVVTEKTGTCSDAISSASNAIMTVNTSLRRILIIAQLDVDTVSALRYDIWVTGVSLDTNVYTYVVDRNPYRSHVPFMFVNAFGVVETFTATGEVDNKKTNEITLSNVNGYAKKSQNKYLSDKTCFSGYLSDREMDWVDDLLMSFAVALYTYHSGLSDEVTITQVDKSDTLRNGLQAFSFEYRRSNNKHFVFASAASGIFDSTFDQTFE